MSKICKNIARTKAEAVRIIRNDLSSQRPRSYNMGGSTRAYGVEIKSGSGYYCGCGETYGYSGTMFFGGKIYTAYCAVCKHCE
jgi:hypothetical protein